MATSKYLVFMRSTPSKKAPPTAEQMQQMYAAFGAWQAKYSANIVDMGGRLKGAGKILRESGVIDGPFAEAKEVVGGYMVVAADDYDHAIQIVRDCPGVVSAESTVEIREIATK
jgi:hypothetical protein